jgi:hypothetical protein
MPRVCSQVAVAGGRVMLVVDGLGDDALLHLAEVLRR